MREMKCLINVDGKEREVKPSTIDIENKIDNNDGKVTIQEACELIAKWLKETRGIDVTAKQIFNLSPSGELWHVFELYAEAKNYFEKKVRLGE
ncbi:hypothetical protein AAHB50_32345 [Bacillus toyonensis]